MKGDLDELLKTKGKRKLKTVDPDECLKINGLGDNRGEARMLMKGKRLIALLSSKNPGIRHPAERQSEILFSQGGTPQVRFQDSDGVHRTPAIGDDSEAGNVGGDKNGRSWRTIPPRDTLPRIGYRQCPVRR